MSYQQNQTLIDALNKCVAECNQCSTACLDEPEVKMLSKCIKLDMDCAQICSTVVAFLARGSEHAKHLLKECAEICNKCADECEKHTHMEHCKTCAEACRACAAACLS